MNSKTEDVVTRFLLNKLSEEERAQVEERFLADNEFFEAVLAAEGALLDQYLQEHLHDDGLSRARKLFQSSPAQQREVEFTRQLIAAVREQKVGLERSTRSVADPIRHDKTSVRSSLLASLGNLSGRALHVNLKIMFAGCLVFLSLIAAYLYATKRTWQAERQAAEQRIYEVRRKLEEQSYANSELSRQLKLEKERRAEAEDLIARMPSRGADELTSVLLSPMSSERGGDSRTVILRGRSKRILLQLELEKGGPYSGYRAILTTVDGRPVLNRDIDANQVRNGRLNIILPPRLPYEDYRIELQGRSEDGQLVHVADYAFNVRR